mgnify:CR=1 FL=1
MNTATILLVIYAFAVIWLGADGHIAAAIGVGIGGLVLLTLYSAVRTKDEGGRKMAEIARNQWTRVEDDGRQS